MTESYLTTDIIVIIVLVVVLVVIGVCAFFTHFYWTKIGVSEIWNTAKWSSMRSSFYRTIGRFSRAGSSKHGSERPFSPASIFSEDPDGTALPAPLRNNKSNPSVSPVPKDQASSPLKSSTTTATSNNNGRRNSSNQVQPVSTITYNTIRANYGTKIGESLENTRIQNIHESGRVSANIETHRF